MLWGAGWHRVPLVFAARNAQFELFLLFGAYVGIFFRFSAPLFHYLGPQQQEHQPQFSSIDLGGPQVLDTTGHGSMALFLLYHMI